MGYYLKDIVSELLVEMGESGAGTKPARLYQMGLSFLRRSNMDSTGFPKIVHLEISDIDTAPLPLDYIQYTKIALCINGRLISLGLNENLCINKNYNDCGVEIGHAGDSIAATAGNSFYLGAPTAGGGLISTGLLFADTMRNGESMGRGFGLDTGVNVFGSYRIDKNSNTIQFANLSARASVVMEYIADVQFDGTDFDVHPFMVEAIKEYIFWMYKARTSKSIGEQQIAQQNFNTANRIMRQRFMSNTLEDWTGALASANYATPKLG